MKLAIATGPETLDEVQAALHAFWSSHEQGPAGVRLEIGIAAAEIAANIVEHGCAKTLHMDIEVLANAVIVEFADDGHPADIDLITIQMPDEMAEHGRGLALAQAALGLLAYFRDEIGNHWKLLSKAFSSNDDPG